LINIALELRTADKIDRFIQTNVEFEIEYQLVRVERRRGAEMVLGRHAILAADLTRHRTKPTKGNHSICSHQRGSSSVFCRREAYNISQTGWNPSR
jgi:hypothetical protein